MSTLTVDFEKAEEMTGVSRFTLRKYVKAGRLKVARVGRRVVVPVSELQRMFAPGTVSTLKNQDTPGLHRPLPNEALRNLALAGRRPVSNLL